MKCDLCGKRIWLRWFSETSITGLTAHIRCWNKNDNYVEDKNGDKDGK